ncbi:MAG: tRNA epoxyqueuosine(34) reductase QueG [Thermoanaerobaculia bacterium]
MKPEDRVRRIAEAAGFDRIGIAALDRAGTGGAFLRWLARGDHAGMRYLERGVEKRLDPRTVLPGARSAVCVALRYAPLESEVGSTPVAENDLWPGVARYARGDDYHDVMLARLEALEAELQAAFPGTATRRYVDTGPVLERELAAKAGLGGFGKNCNLLDPEIGSWFLIGEVLTTLALESDTQVADPCGSCTKCLEACPTGALPEPYRLDSRRCISYWTIEHRGPIPEGMRRKLGHWVFGCDVCQEVCPANVDLGGFDRPEMELPPWRRTLTLTRLLGMSQSEYTAAFRGSAMKRAKLVGLKRNVAVAMGNLGEARFIEPLVAALGDAEPLVRAHAAWALARIESEPGPESGVRGAALERALETEKDPEARTEINAALGLLAAR